MNYWRVKHVMDKQKHKGTFNFNGEVINLWTLAKTKGEAKRFFIIKLAKKLNRTQSSLRRYYSSGKSNFEIKVIGCCKSAYTD